VPVSLVNSKKIYSALKMCNIRLLSAVPDASFAHLMRLADDDPDMTLVLSSREKEALGVSTGAYLAGVNTALLMQNSSFPFIVDTIVSLVFLYKIPLLMLISCDAQSGISNARQSQVDMATELILHTLNIPLQQIKFSSDVHNCLNDAQKLAQTSLHPVAILLPRDLVHN